MPCTCSVLKIAVLPKSTSRSGGSNVARRGLCSLSRLKMQSYLTDERAAAFCGPRLSHHRSQMEDCCCQLFKLETQTVHAQRRDAGERKKKVCRYSVSQRVFASVLRCSSSYSAVWSCCVEMKMHFLIIHRCSLVIRVIYWLESFTAPRHFSQYCIAPHRCPCGEPTSPE